MGEEDTEPVTIVVHTHEVSSVILEYMAYDDASFGDERAEGLDDDRLVLELIESKKVLL
jgi:hypothetical protein